MFSRVYLQLIVAEKHVCAIVCEGFVNNVVPLRLKRPDLNISRESKRARASASERARARQAERSERASERERRKSREVERSRALGPAPS